MTGLFQRAEKTHGIQLPIPNSLGRTTEDKKPFYYSLSSILPVVFNYLFPDQHILKLLINIEVEY